MKTIIAGSRTIPSRVTINILDTMDLDITEVVSGTARGVDQAGEWWAEKEGIPITRFPAEWDKLGKSAGYIRNVKMADYADRLIAIWDGQSKGTKHMIDIANEKGLEVIVRKLFDET